ncbi:MAG: chromosome partitioning protein ParA [Ruminococcus sp.]|nr:chromosome partitioning protein ParA [Ruminococcus sp.]
MKIKIAILDRDSNYLSRMVSAFAARYSEKIELYSFTDLEQAYACLRESKIDVFLASTDFDIDTGRIPPRCIFAYFVENSDIETFKDQRAISKFQKADLIYKQILGLYAEISSLVTGVRLKSDNAAMIYAFMPASGGVGSSTVAAAFARNQAMQGRKTLYFNFELYGCADLFFSGEGQSTLSDIIYTLNSKKTNLGIKLESSVKQDQCGVYFYSSPEIALDMMELGDKDKLRILNEITSTADYQVIVLDLDFDLGKERLDLLKLVDGIVFVSDGSQISRVKTARVSNALKAVEEQTEIWLTSKSYILYNKFSSKTSQALNSLEWKFLGGVPKYEGAATQQIVAQIAGMDVFANLQKVEEAEPAAY